MHIRELVETSEEDRALISLSSSIYKRVMQNEPLGKIGDMFDTPISGLDSISVTLASNEEIWQSTYGDESSNGKELYAVWDDPTRSIILNKDLVNSPRMRTTITHELRHALDDLKSNSYPGNAKRYFTPKKKAHRKDDPYSTTQYRAKPAEINARFVEILDVLASLIPKRYKTVDAHSIKQQLTTDFKNLLVKYEIADLFPEGTQSSDYKRLVKRAYDFMQKEMAHVEATSADKSATGSWN